MAKKSNEIYETLDFRALTANLSQVWGIPITRVGVVSPKILMGWLNNRNPNEHSKRQHGVFNEFASDVGFLSFILVMEITENGEVVENKVLDGHLRIREGYKQKVQALPTAFSTVSREQEAQVLAEYDAIGGLRTVNSDLMKSLLDGIGLKGGETGDFLAELEEKTRFKDEEEADPLDFSSILDEDGPGLGDIEGLDTGSGASKKSGMVKIPLAGADWDEFIQFMRRIGKAGEIKDGSLVMLIPPRARM